MDALALLRQTEAQAQAIVSVRAQLAAQVAARLPPGAPPGSHAGPPAPLTAPGLHIKLWAPHTGATREMVEAQFASSVGGAPAAAPSAAGAVAAELQRQSDAQAAQLAAVQQLLAAVQAVPPLLPPPPQQPMRAVPAPGGPLLRQLDLRWFLASADELLPALADALRAAAAAAAAAAPGAAASPGGGALTLDRLAVALCASRAAAASLHAQLVALLLGAGLPAGDCRDIYAPRTWPFGPPPFPYTADTLEVAGWGSSGAAAQRFELLACSAVHLLAALETMASDETTRVRGPAILAAAEPLKQHLRTLAALLAVGARAQLVPAIRAHKACAIA
jgi:hypothetical protein